MELKLVSNFMNESMVTETVINEHAYNCSGVWFATKTKPFIFC